MEWYAEQSKYQRIMICDDGIKKQTAIHLNRTHRKIPEKTEKKYSFFKIIKMCIKS